MHTSINISNDSWSLSAFENATALRAFYEGYGCDGVELILCGDDFSKFEPGMVRGLHLIFFPEWISLWRNEFDYLDREFCSREAWQTFYRAKNGADLLELYQKELNTAKMLGAEYVVFHMGDNAIDEYYTLQARYSDEQQIDESIRFINEMMDGGGYSFALLLENMWLGCMNLTRPEITRRALNGIVYQNNGLMLDTGHLMSTCPSLRTAEEACGYIHTVLDAHGDTAKKIRGMHLHASLSGDYLSTMPLPAPEHQGKTYLDLYAEATTLLRRIDQHGPFVTEALPGLINRISPEFLCHELSRTDMDDWRNKLSAQSRALLGRSR